MRNMKKTVRLLSLWMILIMLAGCGPERPPVYYLPTKPLESLPSESTKAAPSSIKPDIASSNYNGNSREIDERPCEGVRITAAKGAFWKDPEKLSVKAVSNDTSNIMKIEQRLCDDGYLMMDSWEVDFGLADDELMPGEYKAEIDLSKTTIDPKFYEAVEVARIGDDGEYYLLNSKVENGILSFSSQQNSIISTIVVTGCLASLGFSVYQTIESNWYYIINFWNQQFTEIECKNDYGKYKIQWMEQDLDLRHDKKIDEIISKLKQYWNDALEYRKSLAWYERLSENAATLAYFEAAIEGDEKLIELCKEKLFSLPEVIEKTKDLIDKAYKYLAEVENMRMPLYQVCFKNIGGLGSGKLAEAINRQFIGSYVQFDLYATVIRGFSYDDDIYGDFLLTLTHELFHICQNRYRLPIDVLTEAARYDEMAAVYMETKAYDWFAEHGDVKKVEHKKLTPNNHWARMRLPINGEEDNKLSGDEKQTAKGESGYTLSGFLLYIVDKVSSREEITGHKLMKARSYFTATKISEPIASLLGIPEEEVNTHFKAYFIGKRYEMGRDYMTEYKKKQYGTPAIAELAKGGKAHADLDTAAGGYYMTLRGFQYTGIDPGPVLVALDSGIRKVFPDVQISPGISYSNFTKGAYVKDLKKYNKDSQDLILPMVELHGKDDGNKSGKIGYTVYMLDQTGKPELSENEDGDLVVKMPKNSVAAQDKVVEGYLLTIKTANLETLEWEIPQSKFEEEVIIDKKDLYKDRALDEEMSLIVTLCEYVKNQDKRLLGIESEPVPYSMNTKWELSKFTGCWVLVDDEKKDADSYVIGLIYLEPDEEFPEGEFGYFESQLKFWAVKGRWSEMKVFDYNINTGVLTIPFERGSATFEILPNGHMIMTNYGGSYEFEKMND